MKLTLQKTMGAFNYALESILESIPQIHESIPSIHIHTMEQPESILNRFNQKKTL